MTATERVQLPIILADTAAPVRMWLPQEEADGAALNKPESTATSTAVFAARRVER